MIFKESLVNALRSNIHLWGNFPGYYSSVMSLSNTNRLRTKAWLQPKSIPSNSIILEQNPFPILHPVINSTDFLRPPPFRLCDKTNIRFLIRSGRNGSSQPSMKESQKPEIINLCWITLLFFFLLFCLLRSEASADWSFEDSFQWFFSSPRSGYLMLCNITAARLSPFIFFCGACFFLSACLLFSLLPSCCWINFPQ